MGGFFEGQYYKHQKGENTLCLIVGKSYNEEFIQIITKDFSCNIPAIGDNIFSSNGVRLNINTDKLTLIGEMIYTDLTPIKYDIMGPFKYFKMECRHKIVSMHHKLIGNVVLNGKKIDFTGGTGYIEGDSGTSFPSSYAWVQANDFAQKVSIMASVANIPFMGTHFEGCICVVMLNGKEYRLATYLGAKVMCCTKNKIVIQQGKYKLSIKIDSFSGHELNAPMAGKMTRTIVEMASCDAEFTFALKNKVIFSGKSGNASFEYEA